MVKRILCRVREDVKHVFCVDENENPFGEYNGDYDSVEIDYPDSVASYNPPQVGFWLNSPYCFDFVEDNKRKLYCTRDEFEADRVLSFYMKRYTTHKYY